VCTGFRYAETRNQRTPRICHPSFKAEQRLTLPKARVVCQVRTTHLNAARDSVILLPSHYMADYHGYEWVLGAGHALDTSSCSW
jgi:hypothetical protein